MNRLLITLAAGALIACSEPTAPANPLRGLWVSPMQDLGSGYSRTQLLTFRTDGVLEHEMRLFRDGDFEGAYYFLHEYTVRNDSLFTSPVGPTGPIVMPTWFNNGKLELDGQQLTITYPWTGPADEPITVTQVFFRTPDLPD